MFSIVIQICCWMMGSVPIISFESSFKNSVENFYINSPKNFSSSYLRFFSKTIRGVVCKILQIHWHYLQEFQIFLWIILQKFLWKLSWSFFVNSSRSFFGIFFRRICSELLKKYPGVPSIISAWVSWMDDTLHSFLQEFRWEFLFIS